MKQGNVPECVQCNSILVECGRCETRASAAAWHPGVKCPECGSVTTYPVITFSNAETLVRADCAWDSMEQATFIVLAHWMGFIGPAHFAKFLAVQRRIIHGSPGDLSPHNLFVKAGILSPMQAAAITSCVKPYTKRCDDLDLLKLAAQEKLLTREQIEGAIATRASLKAQNLPVPPMSVILLARGLVSDEQIQKLLLKQKKEGRGLLYAVHREYELTASLPPQTESPARRRTSLMSGTFIN